MIAVQRFIQADEHLPAGRVLHHAYLLTDDAALFLHVFIRKIRREHEFEQNLQILLEPVGAGEVIRRHRVAGEGIRARARAGELLECVAVLVLEHFVLEEVRHARRRVVSFALKGERGIHRAEIGREDGKRLAEALLGQITYAQTVFQRVHLHLFVQGGIVFRHCAAPFIKNTVSSAVFCAAVMTRARSTSAIWSMRASGDTSVPAAACPSQ